MLSGMCSNIFGMDIPQEQWDVIDRYTKETTEKLIKVGLEAIRKARPGELYWTMGSAGFAKNRRTEGGPVDHDAPVLAAKVDGKWIAAVVNYACHCTTLGGDFNKTCADWSGFAQAAIQENFPGAVAFVAIGCGGDANPYPRGSLDLAAQHGKELATEATRLLKGELKRLNARPKGTMTRFNLAFDGCPRAKNGRNLRSSPEPLVITRGRISRAWIAAKSFRPNSPTLSNFGLLATTSRCSFCRAKWSSTMRCARKGLMRPIAFG